MSPRTPLPATARRRDRLTTSSVGALVVGVLASGVLAGACGSSPGAAGGSATVKAPGAKATATATATGTAAAQVRQAAKRSPRC